MIPVRLRLRNFLCYGEDVEPLDLAGIHLACLSGENGHGKSALLDAITWAVWGRARASTDELIHAGESSMEVEFDFLLEGAHYRITRKRDRRTRGQSTLDLHVEVDGDMHALTEANIRATQARIEDLLHMDYETFINSAFLLQGRADEFTTKTPMERKKILADILGLSVYEQYEVRARDRSREKDSEIRTLNAQIAEWERELNLRGDYERELATAEEQAAEASQHLATADADVQARRHEYQALQAACAQRDELTTRKERLRAERAGLERRIAAGQAEIGRYETVLSEQARIEQGYAELLEARQRRQEFDRRLQEFVALTQHKTEVEKLVEAERQAVEMERRRLADALSDAQRRAGDEPRCQAELRSLESPLGAALEAQARREELRERAGHIGEEMACLRTQDEQSAAEIEGLRERAGLLSAAEAQCPLCGSALSQEEQARLLARFEQDIAERFATQRAAREEQNRLAAEVKKLKADIAFTEKQIANLPSLQARKVRLEASLEEVSRATEAAATIQASLAVVSARIERGEWAPEARAQLAEIEANITALGYDRMAHSELRENLARLQTFEGDHARLVAAEENLRQQRAHLTELESIREQTDREWEEVQERLAEVLAGLGRWDACQAELQSAERGLAQARADEARARQAVGAARQRLDACAQLAMLRDERLARRAAALSEKAVYDELRLAFSKNGLQAMIIENVLPEIADEANAILFRMTDGPMRVALDTQRETRDKEVVETLAITVSDQWGARAYELFSGGEAFRINFALRVGLSKLLARRAGASLQTLIIDEGFGTQDARGRERLIEAITSIQDDFEMVLVITHIQELRDAFPSHIEVFKTAAGSQVRVLG